VTLPELLNHVVNQPEVLRYVAPGYSHVDLTDFATKPGNVIMGDEGGFVICAPISEGVFDIHFLLTDEIRGPDALSFIRYCINLMFTEMGATAIVGATPRDNRACRAMGRALGFRPVGEKTDSFGRPCITYKLERVLSATSLAALSGESVH
jgi:hypothetical protein